MAELKLTDEQAAELDGIQADLNKFPAVTGTEGVADLCKIYNSSKSVLEKLVAILKKIPKLKKIGEIIEFLMKIADALCPV